MVTTTRTRENKSVQGSSDASQRSGGSTQGGSPGRNPPDPKACSVRMSFTSVCAVNKCEASQRSPRFKPSDPVVWRFPPTKKANKRNSVLILHIVPWFWSVSVSLRSGCHLPNQSQSYGGMEAWRHIKTYGGPSEASQRRLTSYSLLGETLSKYHTKTSHPLSLISWGKHKPPDTVLLLPAQGCVDMVLGFRPGGETGSPEGRAISKGPCIQPYIQANWIS
jgi:hypothetical protein